MKQLSLFKPPKRPLVVAYGMGVDSTAAIIGLLRGGMRPDLILFADTGGEKRETYDFGLIFGDWLRKERLPPIRTVRYQPRDFKNWPPYRTLEENCLTNGTLPSLAFGFKSCSQKWKVTPQNKFVEAWAPAQEAWFCRERVIKMIGYDAGPGDIRRRNHAGNDADPKYEYRYPLIEWGWDRAECQRQIAAAGLPVPPKSACFFCPATKPHELAEFTPDLLRRIVRMEARAAPRLETTEGLWRKSTKARPGSMSEYIRTKRLLAGDEVDHLQATTHKEIVAFQEGYAEALRSGELASFLATTNQQDYRSPP